MYIYIKYTVVSDIGCQHLGSIIQLDTNVDIGYNMPTIGKCNLKGFFVPFGHRVGKCIFIEIYIVTLDICCQQFGEHVIVG